MSLKSICTDPKLFSVKGEKLQSELVTLRVCKLFMDIFTLITICSMVIHSAADAKTRCQTKTGVLEKAKQRISFDKLLSEDRKARD